MYKYILNLIWCQLNILPRTLYKICCRRIHICIGIRLYLPIQVLLTIEYPLIVYIT